MAEVTAFRHNALPYPVYAQPWAVVFPMLDADGDLVTGATTPDAEVSLNGNTFADCSNESTEIATNSGVYYLLLTAAEMTADIVTVIAKSATAGMKTTVLTFYPRKLVSLRAGTVAANAADGTTLQLDSGAVAVDDYYNGCLLVGVIDGTTECRMIGDYVGSTKVCTVAGPAFITAPDNNDTFTVYLPEGRQISQSDPVAWNGTVVATPTVAGIPVVDTQKWLGGTIPAVNITGIPKVDITHLLGTAWLTPGVAGTPDVNVKLAANVAWASGAITAAVLADGAIDAATFAAGAINAAAIAADALTAAKIADGAIDAATFAAGAINAAAIAADAITAAKIADGAIDAATFAAGAINAAAIAADAIGASELAADAIVEIQTGLATSTALATEAAKLTLIKASTDNLPSDPADESLIIAATNSLAAAIAALNNLSAAQVATEISDALTVDTHAEPTGAPTATGTIVDRLGRVHQALRNKLTVSNTEKTFHDDSAVALWKKALSDDGSTYTEGEGSAA